MRVQQYVLLCQAVKVFWKPERQAEVHHARGGTQTAAAAVHILMPAGCIHIALAAPLLALPHCHIDAEGETWLSPKHKKNSSLARSWVRVRTRLSTTRKRVCQTIWMQPHRPHGRGHTSHYLQHHSTDSKPHQPEKKTHLVCKMVSASARSDPAPAPRTKMTFAPRPR